MRPPAQEIDRLVRSANLLASAAISVRISVRRENGRLATSVPEWLPGDPVGPAIVSLARYLVTNPIFVADFSERMHGFLTAEFMAAVAVARGAPLDVRETAM